MKPLLAACVLLITAFPSHPSEGQTVAEASGNRVTLSLGSSSGVAVGMTGKLQTTQMVQGQEKPFNVARFRVVAVTVGSATAELTARDAASVLRGLRVQFDQPLVKPTPRPTAVRMVRPTPIAASPPEDARVLVEEADGAMGRGQWEMAAGYFERLLRLMPRDPYATKRLAEARNALERAAAAKREAAETERQKGEKEKRKQEGEKQLAYLRIALSRAVAAGDLALESEYARKIIALDPADRSALLVRARALAEAADGSSKAVERRDENGVRRAWAAFESNWPGDEGARLQEEAALEQLAEAQAAERALLAEEQRRVAGGSSKRSGETPGGVTWVRIPAGGSQMGCRVLEPECESDELPLRRMPGPAGSSSSVAQGNAGGTAISAESVRYFVRLTRDFDIAATETTFSQYRVFEASSRGDHAALPEAGPGGEEPVTNVSWEESDRFCRWAGGRLPTEAEWEYAARGGVQGNAYPWGRGISHEDANYRGIGGRDRWERTSPVRSFAANAFGLYDVGGNVWEWVADWYEPNYYGPTTRSNPTGPAMGRNRVMRGGSWTDEAKSLRVSNRNAIAPVYRAGNLGFRCARDVKP